MINLKKFAQLRVYLSALPAHLFNMRGISGCILGHASELFKTPILPYTYDKSRAARDQDYMLGMSKEQLCELGYPEGWKNELTGPFGAHGTQEHKQAVLAHFDAFVEKYSEDTGEHT